MAYITPNTTVHVFKGIPLDNSYEHTVYFTDRATQASTFLAKQHLTFNHLTYQRAQDRQAIRVEMSPDQLLGYNYMMFQNTAFGNKWFYAFINETNYINDDTTEIVYEIDIMQTYALDYTLGKCLIERQHSVTDTPGDNLQPEPVDIGPLMTVSSEVPQGWFDYYDVMLVYSNITS